MYDKLTKRRDLGFNDHRVEKHQFVNLIRIVKEPVIHDNVINDMFLTYAKKLGQPIATQKPNNDS